MAAKHNRAKRIKTESSDGKDFTQKTAMDDLTLLIEDKKMYVSKYVLSLASPVFKKMFESNFKESISQELELPGKSYKVFYQFLRAIYPCGPELTDDVVFDIFPLAEEYQITNLKKKCVHRFNMLLQHSPPMDTSFKLLGLACLYDIDDSIIENYLIKITDLRYSFHQIAALEMKYNICAEMKLRIRDKFITRYL